VDRLAPVRGFDRFQRRHSASAVAVGVLKKVADDGAGNYAALIAYYGFLSLFPLLLLAVAILGFIVNSDASARHAILSSGLPDISSSLANGHLAGSGVGVAVGALGALWAGLGVTNALQAAFNQIGGVAFDRRPGFLDRRLRSLRLLASVGVLQLAATAIAGTIGTGLGGFALVAAAFAVSCAVNVLLFFIAFRQLTDATMPTRSLWPGIVFATVGWELMQTLGGAYVSHVVHRAGDTYGSIATVIGLLAWIYLGARIVVYAAELNSVLAHRYWPRSLLGPATAADEAVRRELALAQQRTPQEQVEVRFEG
jgi:membrane protein